MIGTRDPSHLVEGFLRELANLLLVALAVVTEILCSIDVGRRVNVGLVEHAHDREYDLFHAAGRVPSFIGSFLLIILIGARGMEDGDANLAIGED